MPHRILATLDRMDAADARARKTDMFPDAPPSPRRPARPTGSQAELWDKGDAARSMRETIQHQLTGDRAAPRDEEAGQLDIFEGKER